MQERGIKMVSFNAQSVGVRACLQIINLAIEEPTAGGAKLIELMHE